jgi:hypothetical protein
MSDQGNESRDSSMLYSGDLDRLQNSANELGYGQEVPKDQRPEEKPITVDDTPPTNTDYPEDRPITPTK